MHQRISKKILIYLSIFFILVTINNKKISLDFYGIKEFNIISPYDLDTKKIYDDLKILTNTNIFSFDKKQIFKIINSNKSIEEFKVLKVYPSTLNIEIKKTKYLAITKKDNVDYLVGANGNLIEINDINYELPFIFGNINIENFLNFKKMIDISKFKFSELKSIYYFNSNRWDIVDKKGSIVKFPHNISVAKLNLFYEITKKDNFKDLKTLDFRQNGILVINE